jgi:hypothetical protein
MSTTVDLREIAAVCAGALEGIARDLEQLLSGDAEAEMPDDMRKVYEEHAGMKAALEWIPNLRWTRSTANGSGYA